MARLKLEAAAPLQNTTHIQTWKIVINTHTSPLKTNKTPMIDSFKLLTIADTKEYKVNQLKNKLWRLRGEQQNIAEDIDSIEQNLKYLQEE